MVQNNTRKFHFIEQVRLRACDLRRGMYVCELDRPWLDTPFPLQGFEVKSDDDIEEVMKYCKHVYIDMLRTKVIRFTKGESPKVYLPEKTCAVFSKKDLEAAQTSLSSASNIIKTFNEDIRFGRSPDIELIKGAVSECVNRVTSNPGVMMLLTRLKAKDEYSNQHAINVCIYSIVVGRLLGLDDLKLENLGTCGVLHDVGMVKVPDSVLNKPDPLTFEEMAIIQTHPQEGRDILMKACDIFSGAVDVAYGHHENLDGTGYPRGLQGHQLSLNCKIVGVVDKYDAIVTHQKPYRSAGDHLSALGILHKLARDNKIDSEVTSAFVSFLGIYPPGNIVELSSGEVGIVLEYNYRQRLRPQILVVRDPNKEPTQIFIDLAEKVVDERGVPYRIVNVRRNGEFGIELSQYYDLILDACF